jgi:hypothetical protein
VEHPEEVDIDDLAPRLWLELLGATDSLEASVVDQDVEPALGRVDRLERRRQGGSVRDVGADMSRALERFVGSVEVDRDGTGALLDERGDDGSPDAPRTARHDRDATAEPPVHAP